MLHIHLKKLRMSPKNKMKLFFLIPKVTSVHVEIFVHPCVVANASAGCLPQSFPSPKCSASVFSSVFW